MNILLKNADVLTSACAPVLRNADIGISGNKILFVGPSADGSSADGSSADGSSADGSPAGVTHRGFSPDRVLDCTGRLVIPGLVNAHCHTAMTLLRGYADDMNLESWLFDKIFPAEALLTDEDVYWGTTLGIAEMLRGGVTCVNDMYLKMDNVAAAFRDSGIRATVSIGPLLTEKRGDALADAEGCVAFFKRWNGASDGRIGVNVEIHSIYLYQPDTLREGARIAKDLNAAIHIHILETATERSNMFDRYGRSSVELAAEFGIFDSPVIAAHCVHLDDSDISILACKKVNAVHNPSSNMKLASGFAPVVKMLDKGINVCLGTDGASSNNNLDIFMEMRLAAMAHKGVSGDPTAVPAATAFKMATENGALALGVGGAGVIKAGGLADLTVISLDGPHLQPVYGHLSTLVYAARSSDVETVIADGNILMEKRRLTTIDEEKAIYMANKSARKYM